MREDVSEASINALGVHDCAAQAPPLCGVSHVAANALPNSITEAIMTAKNTASRTNGINPASSPSRTLYEELDRIYSPFHAAEAPRPHTLPSCNAPPSSVQESWSAPTAHERHPGSVSMRFATVKRFSAPPSSSQCVSSSCAHRFEFRCHLHTVLRGAKYHLKPREETRRPAATSSMVMKNGRQGLAFS
ncbi:hypothetical protein VFPBJ_04609 [Purpureocillium lilacinum]|uniref:Uncharacterized protein n=1 Tax=Purpureocillium lilacinum TaxID=33203 RepID=A0A179GVN5_PURLI|nr:hypothetical protein VFPBJ_04609 [Purpureocillium lilacinum]